MYNNDTGLDKTFPFLLKHKYLIICGIATTYGKRGTCRHRHTKATFVSLLNYNINININNMSAP